MHPKIGFNLQSEEKYFHYDCYKGERRMNCTYLR